MTQWLVMWTSFHVLWCLLYILLGEISSYLSLIFYLDYFITVEFREFFIYSRYESSVRHIVSKYFLPVWSLSFHPVKRVFCRAKVLILMIPKLAFFQTQIFSFMDRALVSYLRTLYPALGPKEFLLKVLHLTFKSMIQFELIFV